MPLGSRSRSFAPPEVLFVSIEAEAELREAVESEISNTRPQDSRVPIGS